MIHRLRCAIPLAYLGAALVALPGARADAPTDPAALAPPDALVWLGVSDLTKLRQSIERTNAYKLVNDPIAKKIMSDASLLGTMGTKVKARLAEAMKVEPDALKNPFGGPLSFYLLPPAAESKLPRGVLVAGVAEPELMKDYYARVRARFRETADDYESVDFDGVAIDVFESSPQTQAQGESSDGEDDPNSADDPNEAAPFEMGESPLVFLLDKALQDVLAGEAMPERLAACLTERFLVVSQGADEVKDVLRRLRGGERLADSDDYKVLERRFAAAGPLRFLLNLPAVLKTVDGQDKDALAGIEAMGVRGVGAIVGHADFGATDYDQRMDVFVPIRGERRGLVKILSMANSDTAPAARVNREECVYARCNLDLPAMVDEVERMIRQTDPQSADELRRGLEQVPVSQTETLNLRKELIDHLKAPLALGLAIGVPARAEGLKLRVAIGHDDQAAVTRTLEVLASMAPGIIVPREVRGTMVYDVPMGAVSIAATRDALVAGTSPAVEAALQEGGEGQSLATDAEFKQAAALVAKECSVVVFINAVRMFDASLDLARREDAINPISPAAMILFGMREQMVRSVKDGQYDEARQLRKYHRPSIITMSTVPDGLLIQSAQLAGESRPE